MSNVIAHEVSYTDMVNLHSNLRQVDKDEMEALSAAPIFNLVKQSVDKSSFVKSMYINGNLVCIIGVTPISDGAANPWMLGTPLLDKYPIHIVRQSKDYIAEWVNQYKYLYNIIDARNTKSIKWLKHMGFTIHPAEPMGLYGLPFHPFTMFPRGN